MSQTGDSNIKDDIKLIVGLGNPGPNYEQTRHNAGAWLVNDIATQQQQSFTEEKKFFGLVSKVNIDSHICHLQIPTTYMNVSGQAVCTIAKFYKLKPENILIVHDEIDLPPGCIRLKFAGGHGGHNGLRDIIKALGCNDFFRLRIGVGRPTNNEDVADFVLKRPSKKEQTLIDDSIERALNILPDLLAGDSEKAMRQLHSK